MEPLAAYFSEGALIRYRVLVEVEFLIALRSALGQGSEEEAGRLRAIHRQLTEDDLADIKEQERITSHDVKAVEYFLRDQVGQMAEQVHLGLTSEDVNNLAYGLMLRDAARDVVLPALLAVFLSLRELVTGTGELPMMALTHGQPASPTTLARELAVFPGPAGTVDRGIARLPTHRQVERGYRYPRVSGARPSGRWTGFRLQRPASWRGLGLEPNSGNHSD